MCSVAKDNTSRDLLAADGIEPIRSPFDYPLRVGLKARLLLRVLQKKTHRVMSSGNCMQALLQCLIRPCSSRLNKFFTFLLIESESKIAMKVA